MKQESDIISGHIHNRWEIEKQSPRQRPLGLTTWRLPNLEGKDDSVKGCELAAGPKETYF